MAHTHGIRKISATCAHSQKSVGSESHSENRRTDGRTATTDRITFSANALGNKQNVTDQLNN